MVYDKSGNPLSNGIKARWVMLQGDTFPSCSHCGIGAPFARYRKGNGLDRRDLTDYCPSCGALMSEIRECPGCKWNRDGKKNYNSGVCLYCYMGENFEGKEALGADTMLSLAETSSGISTFSQ